MRAIAVKTPNRGMMIAMEALGERLGFRWRKAMDREFRYGDCAILFIMDGKWLETWGRSVDGLADRWAADPGNKLLTMDEAIEILQPSPPKPLMVAGRTLSFPGDGSVKLSCGTIIPADVCDEIERRRRAKAEAKQYRYWPGCAHGLYRVCGEDVELWPTMTTEGPWRKDSWLRDGKPNGAGSKLEITEAAARLAFPEAFTEAK